MRNMMMWSELILNEKRESIEATLLFGCPNITNSDSGELSRALPGKSSSTLIVAPMALVNSSLCMEFCGFHVTCPLLGSEWIGWRKGRSLQVINTCMCLLFVIDDQDF